MSENEAENSVTISGAQGENKTDGDHREGAEQLLKLGAMGKAFSILEAITTSPKPLSTTELARTTGMTKSTAHRIVCILNDIGFIERDPLQKGYIEGARLVKFALDTLTAAAPRNVRHAILRNLSEQLGETCNFGILAGIEVIYIDRVETKWPLGLRFEAGSRVPAHCTANGKLLLSLQPEDVKRPLLDTMPLNRYTAKTVTDKKLLEEELLEIRDRMIGTDDQEFISGVVCVAVPVITSNGEVVGGIAVSAPEVRASLTQILKFVPSMKRAAQKIGETFKYDMI